MNATIRFSKMQKANSLESYNLYKTALQYDLIEPIIINNRNDLKSERIWKKNFEPFVHQVENLITFCKRLPVTLLADDVGLGKTISSGLIMSELIARKKANKFLVVCPKLLMSQWEEELKNKFSLKGLPLIGSNLTDIKFPNNPCAVITTYNSARIYFDDLEKAGFDMLILDEAHKLRNLHGTEKTPEVALRFKSALSGRMFKYVLMLTATPIQNRLWDLYSLIDLLTTARNHDNPFGFPSDFQFEYIYDSKTSARILNPYKIDKFRSIVYSYMTRIRKQDVNLAFPIRKVFMHKVSPLEEEYTLFSIIGDYIAQINRLSQISILQALVSSPQALLVQLRNMSLNKTIPESLLRKVEAIIPGIRVNSKLSGLLALIKEIRKKKGNDWRIVIFTHRQTTQGVIRQHIEASGIKCGIINGSTSSTNKETLQKFRKESPDINVIISTEAGSEGINLQAANIVVNYDLPWNPMIVEQRIGRVQRLASNHAYVSVYNVVLEDTFEEEIVGRLMSKLNMISSAIGEVESILQGAGLDNDEGDKSFEETIRKLVINSLIGKDTEKATALIEKNIEQAKELLQNEEEAMDELFGNPKNKPTLPESPYPILQKNTPDIPPKDFILQSLTDMGAVIRTRSSGYEYDLDNSTWLMSFEEDKYNYTLYTEGTKNFEKIVNKMTSSAKCYVDYQSNQSLKDNIEMCNLKIEKWLEPSDAKLINNSIENAYLTFQGYVLVRVRISTAHDSYENLVNVFCPKKDHKVKINENSTSPKLTTIESPDKLGLDLDKVTELALKDKNIKAFYKYYQDRLNLELPAAQGNYKAMRKLEDDLTPRVDVSIVGMEGSISQTRQFSINYSIDNVEYCHKIDGFENDINHLPKMIKCDYSSKLAPSSAFKICDYSNKNVISHYLVNSEISDRKALPEYIVTCAKSKKQMLKDEAGVSSITGKIFALKYLKQSPLSGKVAEEEYFEKCVFTKKEYLFDELATSEISGKKYSLTEELCSIVSGKKGHKSEFIFCMVSGKPLLNSEAEICVKSKKLVAPNELMISSLSGKKALPKYFVQSSVSSLPFLINESIQSKNGNYCSKEEAKLCAWTSKMFHPEDIKYCNLTGLSIGPEYLDREGEFVVLKKLFNTNSEKTYGMKTHYPEEDMILSSMLKFFKSDDVRFDSAEFFHDGKKIAVCLKIVLWLGLKTRKAGFIYSLKDKTVIGKIIVVKQTNNGWIEEDSSKYLK